VVVVYDRHASEPEFSLWKQCLTNTDGVIEPQLVSTAGRFSSQSRDGDHPTDSSFPTSSPSGTHDMTTRAESLGEKMITADTGASETSCTTAGGRSTEGSNSGGLSHNRCTDAESSSMSEQPQLERDRCPSAGAVQLSVSAGRLENNVQSSAAESTSALPVMSDDGRNLSNTSDCATTLPPDTSCCLGQPMVSSLSADLEAVSSSSVKTDVVACASSNVDPLHADDVCPLGADGVHESVSLENIQSSASDFQLVCTYLLPCVFTM